MDDISLYSRGYKDICTVEENLKVLEKVTLLFKQYNFVINFNKSISQKSIEYLGYSVSSEDISLSEVHSKAMKNYPYSALIIEQCAVF